MFRASCIRLSGLVITLALVLTPVAFGQGITGSITGNVVDAAGASVPGATVTIRQTDTELARTVLTSDPGAYAVTQLAPGNYTVTIEKPGFKTFLQKNVVPGDRAGRGGQRKT